MKFIKAYTKEQHLEQNIYAVYVNTESILEIHQSMESMNTAINAFGLNLDNLFPSLKHDSKAWLIRTKDASFFVPPAEVRTVLGLE